MARAILFIICAFFIILVSGCVDKTESAGTIVKVVDGDTIDVNDESEVVRVRLLCVDTPEKFGKNYPDEYCCGDSCISNLTFLKDMALEATDYASKELMGKNVTLIGNEKDKYGRLLALVEVDGQDFNRKLIEKGLARYMKEYDCPKADEYAALEIVAKENKVGVWAAC